MTNNFCTLFSKENLFPDNTWNLLGGTGAPPQQPKHSVPLEYSGGGAIPRGPSPNVGPHPTFFRRD